jgi:hypothetical protein
MPTRKELVNDCIAAANFERTSGLQEQLLLQGESFS